MAIDAWKDYAYRIKLINMNDTYQSNLPLDVKLKHLKAALNDYKSAITSLGILDSNDDKFGTQGTKEEVECARQSFCLEAKNIYSSLSEEELALVASQSLLSTAQLAELRSLPDFDSSDLEQEYNDNQATNSGGQSPAMS